MHISHYTFIHIFFVQLLQAERNRIRQIAMNGSLSDPLESLKAAGQRQRNAAFNQPLTQNGNGNTNGHQQVFFFYILQCFLLALGF